MRQRGVALIMVLLLLSMAVLIGAQVMESLEASRTRTENALVMEQGYAYLLSAEALALQALQSDQEKDRRGSAPVDACDEQEWARELGPLPWDNGIFSVSIQDLQGRFNLNNLAVTGSEGRVLDRLQVERFKRLLRQVLPLPEAADALAEEAADWTDSNMLVDGLGGAEDTEYQAWRTSNLPFAHVSELRALRSATAELWRGTDEYPAFTRYIAALPEGTRINVNTAPREVLLSLVPALGEAAVDAVIAARGEEAFATVDALLALPGLATVPEAALKELKDAVVVSSEYFQVMSEVVVAGRTTRLVSIVYRPRQGGVPVVVMRDLGATFMAPEGACNPGWVAPETRLQE